MLGKDPIWNRRQESW